MVFLIFSGLLFHGFLEKISRVAGIRLFFEGVQSVHGSKLVKPLGWEVMKRMMTKKHKLME